MPLIPVTVGETVDERWSRILNESNIDGIERTDLLSDEEVRKYTDLHGPDTPQLIRIVVDLERSVNETRRNPRDGAERAVNAETDELP
jgi:hypothetical protein